MRLLVAMMQTVKNCLMESHLFVAFLRYAQSLGPSPTLLNTIMKNFNGSELIHENLEQQAFRTGREADDHEKPQMKRWDTLRLMQS